MVPFDRLDMISYIIALS